jgi:hypothetical protein
VIHEKMKILYRHSMLEDLGDRSNVDPAEVPIDHVPESILEIIRTHEAFRESTSFGASGLGHPEEYEKLVLEDENGSRTFEYFNKGISYMIAGTEEDRPVFQVFTHFMLLQTEGHV